VDITLESNKQPNYFCSHKTYLPAICSICTT